MQYSELFVGYGPAREVRPPHRENDGHVWSFMECRAYIGQLHRLFGPPPNGAKLFIKTHEDYARHWWYVVVCRFQSKDRDAATEYVIRAQDRVPERWDPQARAELGLDAPQPAPAAKPANGTHAESGTPAAKPSGKPNDKPNGTPLKQPVRHKAAPKPARSAAKATAQAAAKPAETRADKRPAIKPTPRAGAKPAPKPAKAATATAGKGAGHAA